ncbi:MAG: DUF4136 domain-containing protein [Deltaproteobacteria bacterium]|nr:DUF4136 domain-containing protein [Deltaproteobacteria bacterium]MBW2176923.1 DUF4136 domain-containing protein [Deltaproteobacteria bacterium]
MRTIFLVLMVCVAGAVAGCSSVYDVKYDYDQKTDFSRMQAYGWLPTPEGADMDDISIERVKKAVNTELKAKGLRLSSQDPDFLIAEHMGAEEKVQINNWGYAYGPYNGYWGGYWGNGGVSEYRYEEGTLILDFVDAETHKLIWRGAAKAEIDRVNTPEKKDKLVAEAVQKILESFPPQGAQ